MDLVRCAAVLAIAITTLVVAAFGPRPALAQQAGPTLEQIQNATYPVEIAPGGSAKLVNGTFEAPAAPGSASKILVTYVKAAIGVVAGQPGGAVVLASSGGGSGTFYDLYAVDAAGKPVAKASLGDRIQLQSIAINGAGNVVVSMLVHAPTDQLCCPTLRQTREWALRGGALVLLKETNEGPIATATAPASPLPGRTGNAGALAAHGETHGGRVPWIALGAAIALTLAARAAAHARPAR